MLWRRIEAELIDYFRAEGGEISEIQGHAHVDLACNNGIEYIPAPADLTRLAQFLADRLHANLPPSP